MNAVECTYRTQTGSFSRKDIDLRQNSDGIEVASPPFQTDVIFENELYGFVILRKGPTNREKQEQYQKQIT